MEKTKNPAGYGTTGKAFKLAGESHCRWIEKPASAYGLRFVGFADEIAKRNYSFAGGIDHRGWYTDDDGDREKIRGVVMQIAGKDKRARYVAGYADPYNDGCYLVTFDSIIEGERGNDDGPSYDKGARECAFYADAFAEAVAEQERDYNRAWQAGREYDDLGDRVASARKACLALIREARQACKSLAELPAIKATIRAKVEGFVAEISDARERRRKLLDEYGREPGFVE